MGPHGAFVWPNPVRLSVLDEHVTSEPGRGRGTLVLADISGYTAFLQAVAHAHAADMAAGTFVRRRIRC